MEKWNVNIVLAIFFAIANLSFNTFSNFSVNKQNFISNNYKKVKETNINNKKDDIETNNNEKLVNQIVSKQNNFSSSSNNYLYWYVSKENELYLNDQKIDHLNIKMDNTTILHSSNDGNICWVNTIDSNSLYKIENKNNEFNVFKIDDKVNLCSFSSDGNICWFNDNNLNIKKINNDNKIIKVGTLDYSSSKILVSSDGNTCWVYDKKNDVYYLTENNILKVNNLNVNVSDMKISNDGRYLFIVINNNEIIKIDWNSKIYFDYTFFDVNNFKISNDGSICWVIETINNTYYKFFYKITNNEKIEFKNNNSYYPSDNFKISDDGYIFYGTDKSNKNLYEIYEKNKVLIPKKIFSLNETIISFSFQTNDKNKIIFWIFTTNYIYVSNNFQNLVKVNDQKIKNLSFINFKLSSNGESCLINSNNDYGLYKIDINIIDLFLMNNNYVFNNGFYYFENSQKIYFDNSFFNKIYLNGSEYNNFNKIQTLKVANSKPYQFELFLNSSFIQYLPLFIDDPNQNTDKKININFWIINKFDGSNIKYVIDKNNTNAIYTNMGIGLLGNTKGWKIVSIYTNSNESNNTFEIDLSNIKNNFNLKNSYYQLGKYENNNFVSTSNKILFYNNKIIFKNDGIYKLNLVDVFGNCYIEYVEVGIENQNILLDYLNVDFLNKKNNLKVNINISSKNNFNYTKIYNWMSDYQYYFNTIFQDIFNNVLNNYSKGFDFSNQFANLLNEYWNKIELYSIPISINDENINNLSSLYNIDSSLLEKNLKNEILNETNNNITSEINKFSLLSNSENLKIIKDNISTKDDLDKYILYVNNYNNWLKNDFKKYINNYLKQIDIPNTNINNIENIIINNRNDYLNSVIWNKNISQTNFSKNINIKKIQNDFYKHIKNNKNKNNNFSFLWILLSIILLIIFFIILIRNRIFLKMILTKKGRKKLKDYKNREE